LAVVSALQRFAQFELGTTVSRLAVAWTLANPAVQVAIVGTRNPNHVNDAVAATDLALDQQTLKVIDEIVRSEVPVGGPSPETV
jgi:aryl-alcohol dehydrogenase-like predicted oxidoreductase